MDVRARRARELDVVIWLCLSTVVGDSLECFIRIWRSFSPSATRTQNFREPLFLIVLLDSDFKFSISCSSLDSHQRVRMMAT